MLDLNTLDGFEWDSGNREKNWQKHQVASGECEEVFFNQPLLLYDDNAHSLTEPRYYALGQTSASRFLFIAFTVRGSKIRIISARDMSRNERGIYEHATP